MVQNDGYNLIDLSKDMVAKKCMNLVLTTNALLTIADSYDDLPGDLVETLMAMDFKKMDLTNSVSACQGDCRKIGGVKEKADVQTSAFFD